MTNAEKYLKDGVKEQLIKELSIYGGELDEFFEEQVTPTLTEDERVILRNIKGKYTTLYRNDSGYLILQENSAKEIGKCHVGFNEYNHLFQFIKERRRIRDRRTIERRIKSG